MSKIKSAALTVNKTLKLLIRTVMKFASNTLENCLNYKHYNKTPNNKIYLQDKLLNKYKKKKMLFINAVASTINV